MDDWAYVGELASESKLSEKVWITMLRQFLWPRVATNFHMNDNNKTTVYATYHGAPAVRAGGTPGKTTQGTCEGAPGLSFHHGRLCNKFSGNFLDILRQ